ncbi:S8 family serine peptidase [Mucilaginibacter sp. BJC16-A38]|uniref:S8 family serine peptidase n=1 Tax=Mucilaginibacter phenanthrenivorans TaxID=1234842 RepID=UPI00215735B9|nr:S8 family serine peptidase [Mucilaginibacter phenanthrenivorans]MCR8557447.1 S8 family serine peptidase [Mucilaginibacter phenanthrenivorans]
MNILQKYTLSSLTFGAMLLSLNSFGQQAPKMAPDPPKNWHAMDLKTDGFYGISLKQAYLFLKGKKSKTVIVTTIDSGIDTTQTDLKSILWVNPKEIPNNGKDDDGDGLVDDVHGWDFLGGKGGKVDFTETTEEVRQYNKLKGKYLSTTTAPAGQEKEFAFWQQVKSAYDTTMSHSQTELKELTMEVNVLSATNFYIKRELKLKSDQTFNIADLKRITTTNDTISQSKTVWESVFSQIGEDTNNAKVLKDITEEYAKQNNNITPDLEARARIVGDDPDVNDGKPYGNNVLKNPDASHGTGVAGLIGAVRNNGYGIDGVADNVRIMSIKAVPNGDEYDKDIANAIRYAVDHGALVINMSFGKKISPHKEWVDAAFKYAASKDVLLVQASGNDNHDMDAAPEFPNDTYLDGTTTDNVISVGASGPKPDTLLAATFSNYGQKSVDVFAPGVKVTSIDTDAEFNTADGTSFSSPIVSGIAALILEYYPELSAKQVKQAILGSAAPVTNRLVNKPGSKEKVEFTTLSKTGGIVNAHKALEIASKMKGERK